METFENYKKKGKNFKPKDTKLVLQARTETKIGRTTNDLKNLDVQLQKVVKIFYILIKEKFIMMTGLKREERRP